MIYSVYSKSPYFRKYPINNLWRLPSQLDMHLRRCIDTYSDFFCAEKKIIAQIFHFIIRCFYSTSYNINNAREIKLICRYTLQLSILFRFTFFIPTLKTICSDFFRSSYKNEKSTSFRFYRNYSKGTKFFHPFQIAS